jgi:hypothetical protein
LEGEAGSDRVDISLKSDSFKGELGGGISL